ncbi:efflux transporter, RND family, MFP subunit [Gottschalkia acidurici 9a]|uniref:Efflux transporter, RND family, MFP subunit n=1 Tax=Gottschalkia acidurici (strain ATCC 7906 / DSM 604 / BCRC 14475 / CIP 104303 / KCTC 5404 / NCIMB 10678 / 9a) TaxID=1128398 RepID=K0AY96_GOTA9|nr:efflux RND transporter periplasmic adaptor subunit [Gottschalkia acidurici]AFS77351.1 efflux transporter, RND family, MFP subunit [Gottschalkia acidurici 9a]
MKFNKKIVGITAGIILSTSLIGLGVAKSKNQAKSSDMVVETVKVESAKDFSSTLDIDGVIKSKEEVSITTDIPSKVIEVLVKEGDVVKKGDIIAKLETQDIVSKISSAEVNLNLEKERLKSLQTDLARASKPSNTLELEKNIENARIDYSGAKNDYETSKQLFESGAVSKEKMDSDERKMLSAKNTLEITESRLREVRENGDSNGRSKDEIQGSIEVQKKTIELQEINLKKERESLDNAVIKSPIDGTITLSNTKVGILATTANPLFTISNTDKLEVEVEVGEYDISSIRLGQKTEITGDAFKDKKLSGTVSYIAPSAGDIVAASTNNQASGGSKESKVTVKIDLEGNTKGLKPGYNANTVISTSHKDKALVVPYESIYKKQDGKDVVFLVGKDNVVKEISVRTGISGDIKQEIISDKIKAGDKIILAPNESTKSGMKVNVIEDSENNKKNDEKKSK